MPLEKVHLIGFSLGAHVAGFAGAELGNVSRITGTETSDAIIRSSLSPRRNDLDRSTESRPAVAKLPMIADRFLYLLFTRNAVTALELRNSAAGTRNLAILRRPRWQR